MSKKRKKQPTLDELIEQAKLLMQENGSVYYVIQTIRKKEVISNNDLYHLTKDGGEFEFLWEPSEELITKYIGV